VGGSGQQCGTGVAEDGRGDIFHGDILFCGELFG